MVEFIEGAETIGRCGLGVSSVSSAKRNISCVILALFHTSAVGCSRVSKENYDNWSQILPGSVRTAKKSPSPSKRGVGEDRQEQAFSRLLDTSGRTESQVLQPIGGPGPCASPPAAAAAASS